MAVIKKVTLSVTVLLVFTFFLSACGMSRPNDSKVPVTVQVRQLVNSGKNFINQEIMITGKVVGLKYNKEFGTFLIELEGQNKIIKCITLKLPKVLLLSKITITGSFNGDEVAVKTIKYKNHIYDFSYNQSLSDVL
ncbi:MAG TPA: hypothetical protein QF753_21290 [Victivallales bacterium]|nr:hypothetical protein [Victivallales bacterium]